MERKAFPLYNKGMTRDLSVSKAGESCVYENHNVRITADEYGTLLSVTNERGNRLAPLNRSMIGKLAGWNVLNGHILLFMHDDSCDGDYDDVDGRWVSNENGSARNDRADRIYRVDYEGGDFSVTCLYNGNLNLSLRSPIESVVHYESDNVQKIYWVDGRNVLRFMNFMGDTSKWVNDDRAFDTNRPAGTGASMSLSKNMSGNTRPNGVVQYFLTYFNQYGQETGWVLASDLVYLAPERAGGSPDGTNVNGVTISLSGLDTSFSHFRVYSVFRSSLGGTPAVYLVAEDKVADDGMAIVSDDGAPLATEDVTRILYLGSRPVIAGTMAHKDGTLFLGDLKSVGRKQVDGLEAFIASNFRGTDGVTADLVEFVYSHGVEDGGGRDDRRDIPYVANDGTYAWESQLSGSSSVITTFKGGEKYRFAIQFRTADGVSSDAFWIGDRENPLYPVIDTANDVVRRPIAKLDLSSVKDGLEELLEGTGYVYVQLMMAEATYADRGVKAQGIVNPTMFNVWERYNDRLYSMASWISRPRHSGFTWKHFQPVANSITTKGELECNYWEEDAVPKPYYRIKNPETVNQAYEDDYVDEPDYEKVMLIFWIKNSGWLFRNMQGCVAIVKASRIDTSQPSDMDSHQFNTTELSLDNVGTCIKYVKNNYVLEITTSEWFKTTSWYWGNDTLWANIDGFLDDKSVPRRVRPTKEAFINACDPDDYWSGTRFINFKYPAHKNATTVENAANYYEDDDPSSRWHEYEDPGNGRSGLGGRKPAYYRQQYMFVDENVVTLNSPELEQEAVMFDGADMGFRIVGVAKMSSVISDYEVDVSATHNPYGGVTREKFTSAGSGTELDGLVAGPLLEEDGLMRKDGSVDDDTQVKDMKPSDYEWDGNLVRYWLRMWNHTGSVTGFDDSSSGNFSRLSSKVFANLRFSYATRYNDSGNSQVDLPCGPVRMYNHVASQYVGIDIGAARKFYNANIDWSVAMPLDVKYPILYSRVSGSNRDGKAFLYSDTPVELAYLSSPHAVLSLETEGGSGSYVQTLLPRMFDSEKPDIPEQESGFAGPLLPWLKHRNDLPCAIISYKDSAPYVPSSDDAAVYSAERGTVTVDVHDPDNYFQEMYLSVKQNYYLDKLYVPISDGTMLYMVDLDSVECVDDWMKVKDARVLAKAEIGVSGVSISVDCYRHNYYDPHGTVHLWVQPIDVGMQNISGDGDSDVYGTYGFSQGQFTLEDKDYDTIVVKESDPYLLIGEIYEKYSSANPDMRYGGTSEAAIRSNRFIPAGPQYVLDEVTEVYGNRGDTFFQRWDCLKTMPFSKDRVNGVIDVTSFMVETHVNLDGRYDLMRGTGKLASIDVEDFGKVNPVYSQPDDYIVGMDLDPKFNLDSYRSSLTWTMPKAAGADVDEWTHVTLASQLDLDGDKGPCTALRRSGNALLAFQDRGIAEVLFNSRTQLSTAEGVPVELANSGKVDGKRYITDKYGCGNKWSIAEGRRGVYFVDGVNKMLGVIGEGIDNLSGKHGMSAWFRQWNSTDPWNPADFNNFVSFYDRVRCDLYLMSRGRGNGQSCLVYNEQLDAFTSFYDYAMVPMMANVGDRFVSYMDGNLWLQNEGKYCNFFGSQYDFWSVYRVCPEPYGDKVWTNVEYRADFMRVLDDDGDRLEFDPGDLIDGGDRYEPDMTFDEFAVWDEYQTTGTLNPYDMNNSKYPDIRKKFRTWRLDIPRALKEGTNRHGLDRIRNPWIFMRLGKRLTTDWSMEADENQCLMDLHTIDVTYFGDV